MEGLKVPVVKVAIRGANGRMGLQAIYASMENNEDVLNRARQNALTNSDVWIEVVFGAFTADIPTVQQLLAGVMRSEKDKVLEGYDKSGNPIYRMKSGGNLELRTKYVSQSLDEESQRSHVISFDRQEIIDTKEGLPAIKIFSKDKKEVLSTIRHVNVRLGELSGEAIMDKVLDLAEGLGANVLLSCVGDTAKKSESMKKWLDKIHEKNCSMGFLESAPAKGWGTRMLSRQDVTSVLCSRNFSPTGTLFRTGLSLKRPLFAHDSFELNKAVHKFKKIFTRIIGEIILTGMFRPFAQLLKKQPETIKEIEGETVLINFPLNFLTIISPNYLKFSFYEDNEYGYVCAAMIPNLKAVGLIYKDRDFVKKERKKALKFEAITNIPGVFGTDWIVKSPQEVITRGGVVSTSSCTTNGNVVGDFIVFLALCCYYDFFYPSIKEYFLTPNGKEDKRYEKIIEEKFSEFKGYLKKLVEHRAEMIRTVFNFYYDEVLFMDTDMQHGLTRSESPDVIEFLRETSSGSQTEVPRLLSLPERETEYFKGLKARVEEQSASEDEDKTRASLNTLLKKIDDSIKELHEDIDIVTILDKIERK